MNNIAIIGCHMPCEAPGYVCGDAWLEGHLSNALSELYSVTVAIYFGISFKARLEFQLDW